MPQDYGAEFDTLTATKDEPDYGSEFDSLAQKRPDYESEFDSLISRPKLFPTYAAPRWKPTKLSEVERSWWGGVKNPHDKRFFDEKVQGFIKAIESPEGQRLVRGMENPAVAIFDAIPKVTEQQIQDALDIFSASGLSMASASGNPSFENLKLAEELRQSKSTKPGSTAKVIAGTRDALQITTEALAEPESLAMIAVPPVGLVGRLVSLGFAADMLYHMPEQVTELKKATAEKDTAGQVRSVAGMIFTGLFAGLAIKHGLTPESPVINSLAEHIVTGKDASPAAEIIRSEINKFRSGKASPEFVSLFKGVDPKIAGTTPEKVSEFAASVGMVYRPVPYYKEDAAPEQTQTRTETRLTRTTPEPTQSQMEYGTGRELPPTPAVWTQPEPRLTRSPEPKPAQTRSAFVPTPGVRLVPVLESTTGRFFPGLTHADALAKVMDGSRTGSVSPEDLEAAFMAQASDAQHKFLNVDTGRVLTRAEAGKAVGYSGELQSEYLPKAYKESSLAEARMLSVMSPEERADYLSRKNPVNETTPQTPSVPKQASGQVPEKEQAKDLPENPEGVRTPVQPPAPAQLPVGQVAVQDLSLVRAVDLNPFKTTVEVMYDPGTINGTPGPVQVAIAVNQPGQGQNQLLVQLPGPTPRTIWAAKISDLVQSGVLARQEQGYVLDTDQLWSSPFLVKATDARFKPYKLPGQKLDRSGGFASEDVDLAASEQNPFFGAILSALNLSPSKLKALAGAKSGNKVYAGKDAVKVAQQVREFFLRDLKQKLDKKRDSISDMSQNELEQIYLESRIRTAIRDNKQNFTPDEVSEAVSYLSQVDEVQRTDTPRVEVPLAEASSKKDQETGVVSEGDDVGASWDPARTDQVLGRIEDKNPKLYQSLSADPENDRAWAGIEEELVKFLNGDKVGAEILAETIRAKRMEGWMAGQPRPEGAEFEEHNWLTGISATGKDGILALFQNRNIQLDPQVRRIGLALLQRIPAKYLKDLTFSVDATGTSGGEFIPWLKTAKIAMDNIKPDIAAHEIAHYLASFLTDKERGIVSGLRASEMQFAKQDQARKRYIEWIESRGGSVTSMQVSGSPEDFGANYHLINDDEYFAHYASAAGAKPAPELKTLLDKVKDIISRIISAIKAWLGNRDAYFDQILRKFEKGEFDVNAQGGMLFERNNQNRPKSLPPIKSREELKKYTEVDQGHEEAALVRTLTYEQNHPLVAHARPLFDILPDKVKAELPGISSRLDVLDEVIRGGVSSADTPLKHYAVVVNSLSMQEEAQKLGDEIEQIVSEIQKQNQRGDKASLAEIRAKQLEETAQASISSYKDLLLSEQRRTQNDGVAQGLSEAIKTLDGLRDSTESLKRAIEFIAEGVTLDELNNPALTTQQVVELFKARIIELAGAATWQQAVIPPDKDKPGVNNEQLRIAVRILQENQRLVQDLITHKELSDPDLARIMRSGEKEFDEHIAGFNHRSLRSFLKTFRSVASAKDKARQVYLKHRLRLKDLIERVETKVEAEDFLHSQVLGSVQFRSAMEESSKRNFQSTRLIRDHNGNNALKRTYYNPLNLEESLEIVDGPGLEDYERNRENFDKVLDWFDAALNSDRLDPLDRQAIEVEEMRILDQEQNEAYSPRAGKRVDWWLNTPSSIFSNFVGHSAQYALGKIGGRAGIQVGASFQAKSEALRRTIEVRHEQQPLLQKTILEAMRGHTMTQTRWVKEVAEPIIASYNSLGARQLKATDSTRYGHRISGKDMEAVRLMKKFEDSMVGAARDMDLHTSKLHPIRIKEVISGREILRDPQGAGTEMTMARRWNWDTMKLADAWSKLKNNRSLKDAAQDLAALIQTGPAFQDLVLSHIYSGQRYPDYDNPTRFKSAYREIYRQIMNGQPPANLNEIVDVVFRDQTGTDTALQLTSEEITREIVKEVDQFVSKILDERSKDRAADTPGMQVKVESADNFMTKPRGKMIAPDSFYRYSVVDRDDIKWLVRSVQEVHEQIALDGLEKVKKMLEEYVSEWEDRARHPKAHKESTEEQMSGDSWLNYREAKNILNQVRRNIDKSSPEAFRTFVDEQFGTTGRRAWGILIQSLLQSSTVLKNNLLGMNLRQSQMDQQWRADGVWMGMPRWLLKMPSLARNGIAMPITNIPAYLMQGQAYKKTLKKGVKLKIAGKEFLGEDALRLIISNPELANTVISQVKATTLKRAINLQRAKDLGAAGKYGLVEQLKRYVGPLFTGGGEIENLDPTTSEKIHGGINSILGLFQESGGGLMLPKAAAPRKLEEFLNFQAIRYADMLIEELTLNIKEALADRARLGITSPITDQELLGDHRAHQGDAMYMRKMFNRAGLNLDALIKHLERNPDADLLQHSEWNSFVLEVAKEVNMPAGDNRIVFKSGFARSMASLMGYGIWYNERMAETLARNSQKKFDLAAVYRAMYFLGVIVAMGVFVGVPLQRLLKRLLNNEEDQTGHFDEDNTGWRNAGVLWEQTAPFWPIIGSVMSQLYDAKAGGGKLFNFLPVSVAAQALQSANEVAQTGNAFYPTIKLIRSWLPNTKIILNRIPATEGLMEVNSAGRILRSTSAGDVEVRTQKGGGNIRYSPVSTQVQMAVNELAKASPDYDAINQYRNDAVKVLVGRGAKKDDAKRRFDLSVLTRYPENTVFGRPLTEGERGAQTARMTTGQASKLSQVESAFDRYATTFGLRAPSQQRQRTAAQGSRSASGRSLRLTRRRRRGSRLVRNRSLVRRRSRRLVRG